MDSKFQYAGEAGGLFRPGHRLDFDRDGAPVFSRLAENAG